MQPSTDLFQPYRYPALLNLEDVVRATGLSRSTIKREVAAGRLPTVRVRTRPYVPRDTVVGYLADRLVEAEEQA